MAYTLVRGTAKLFAGPSADAKPVLTLADFGARAYEEDTGKRFFWTGAEWDDFPAVFVKRAGLVYPDDLALVVRPTNGQLPLPTKAMFDAGLYGIAHGQVVPISREVHPGHAEEATWTDVPTTAQNTAGYKGAYSSLSDVDTSTIVNGDYVVRYSGMWFGFYRRDASVKLGWYQYGPAAYSHHVGVFDSEDQATAHLGDNHPLNTSVAVIGGVLKNLTAYTGPGADYVDYVWGSEEDSPESSEQSDASVSLATQPMFGDDLDDTFTLAATSLNNQYSGTSITNAITFPSAVPKASILAVDFCIRLHDRRDIPVHLSRAQLMDIGFRNDMSWPSTTASAVIPCVFYHGNRGSTDAREVMLRPRYFDCEQIRLADRSLLVAFFTESADGNDFTGMNVRAYDSGSMWQLRAGSILYQG